MDSLMQKIQVTTEIPELLSVLKYVKGPTWFFPSSSKSKREKMEKRKFTHTSKLWCDYFKMYFFFLLFFFLLFFILFLLWEGFHQRAFCSFIVIFTEKILYNFFLETIFWRSSSSSSTHLITYIIFFFFQSHGREIISIKLFGLLDFIHSCSRGWKTQWTKSRARQGNVL